MRPESINLVRFTCFPGKLCGPSRFRALSRSASKYPHHQVGGINFPCQNASGTSIVSCVKEQSANQFPPNSVHSGLWGLFVVFGVHQWRSVYVFCNFWFQSILFVIYNSIQYVPCLLYTHSCFLRNVLHITICITFIIFKLNCKTQFLKNANFLTRN